MKFLIRPELQVLLEPQSAWCVSLYMPTHRAANSQEDRIRLKNLLRKAAEPLVRNGLTERAVATLLAPAEKLAEHDEFWRTPEDGLALFISEGKVHSFRFPLAFEEMVAVARRFALRPLLPLLYETDRLYVLALSQNEARLLGGTRLAWQAVPVEGMPHSLAEAMRFSEFEKQTQYHTVSPSAGRGTMAIFHGQGAASDETKHEMVEYFRQVNAALHRLLRNEGAPLVIAAVDSLLPLYREVNTYPHLTAESISGNPEERSAADLQRAGWAIVAQNIQAAQDEALTAFRNLDHTARASHQTEEIVPAAVAGRVETLFVSAGGRAWGAYDRARDTASVHAEPLPGDEDLVDLAALKTLRSNGSVMVMPAGQMPGNMPIAAVFRY